MVVREQRDESWAEQAGAIGSKGEREGANALHIWCPQLTSTNDCQVTSKSRKFDYQMCETSAAWP